MKVAAALSEDVAGRAAIGVRGQQGGNAGEEGQERRDSLRPRDV